MIIDRVEKLLLYSGGVKLWRIDHFRAFGEENVGKFIIANISCILIESGIWLDKILANDICFAKFAKVFTR